MAALFMIAKGWKTPRCLSTDTQITKMGSIHTMEHYSAIKRNELLIHATAWVNLGNTIQAKKPDSKDTYSIDMKCPD